MKIPFRSKEVSWLSFNARVLQEGSNPEVPLMERVKFLGIYSNNLDEFFRVRVATLQRLIQLGDRWKDFGIPNPRETLKEINRIVSKQAEEFNRAYASALAGLKENGIEIVDNRQVPKELHDYLYSYFRSKVSPHLMPIMLKASAELPQLADVPMYLAVRLEKRRERGRPAHALLEIPSALPRFVVLPKKPGKNQ